MDALLATPVLIWLGLTLVDLSRWAQTTARLPRWDMAKYGAAASRMQEAMESWDPLALISEIHQLSSWPFVLPLVEGLVFVAFGNDFAVARLLMVVCFACTCLLATQLAGGLGRSAVEGRLLGLWTAVLLISSPMLQLYGVLNMLEMPGTLLTLAALWAYFKVLDDPQRPAPWWLLGGLSTLLFFCKYNYGLIWMLALLASELRRRRGSWRQVVVWLWGSLVHRSWGLWEGFVVLVLGLLALLRVGGGGEWDLGFMTLRATSIGNPMYGLLLLSVGRQVMTARRRRRFRHRFNQWAPSTRILGLSLALPILLWMLIPPHCKDFFGFVENRTSGLSPWSPESWWFYGRALEQDYLLWSALGLPLLFLAAFQCLQLPHLGARDRTLTLLVMINGAALLVHPYKLSRFALTLFVPLVLLGCSGAIDLIRRLQGRWFGPEGRPRQGVGEGPGHALALLTLGLLLATSGWGPLPRPEDARQGGLSLAARFAEESVGAANLPLLDRVLEHGAASEATALIGTWNLFSPALVEWRRAQRRSAPTGLDSTGELWMGRDLRRQVRRRGWPPQVLVLELVEGSWRSDLVQAYRDETAASEPFLAVLRAGTDFDAAEVEIWPDSGYRLLRFQCRSDSTLCGPEISE